MVVSNALQKRWFIFMFSAQLSAATYIPCVWICIIWMPICELHNLILNVPLQPFVELHNNCKFLTIAHLVNQVLELINVFIH
jgi:hypothetical protein